MAAGCTCGRRCSLLTYNLTALLPYDLTILLSYYLTILLSYYLTILLSYYLTSATLILSSSRTGSSVQTWLGLGFESG